MEVLENATPGPKPSDGSVEAELAVPNAIDTNFDLHVNDQLVSLWPTVPEIVPKS